MNDRRNFLTACLSGAAWLMGWKGEKHSVLGIARPRDVSAVTGKVNGWSVSQHIDEPLVWMVTVSLSGGQTASFTEFGKSPWHPRIGDTYTFYTTRSKPCES